VLIAATLDAALPEELLVGPRFVVPGLELLLLVPQIAVNPTDHPPEPAQVLLNILRSVWRSGRCTAVARSSARRPSARSFRPPRASRSQSWSRFTGTRAWWVSWAQVRSGYFLHLSIPTTVGIILLVVSAVLMLLGHTVGGRNHWF
jgi:hypothetical protein